MAATGGGPRWQARPRGRRLDLKSASGASVLTRRRLASKLNASPIVPVLVGFGAHRNSPDIDHSSELSGTWFRSGDGDEGVRSEGDVGQSMNLASKGFQPMKPASEIFIVDDNEEWRETLAAILELEGYRVTGFSEGMSFLKEAKTRVPICIFLDVVMPGASGLELLKELKEASYARRSSWCRPAPTSPWWSRA
jgi:hypothetical protein